jgi:hypothetical protein
MLSSEMAMRAENHEAVPVLRLVGCNEPAALPGVRRHVADETRHASQIEAADVRMVFATEVARAIEGGRAAILRPERRRALVGAAVSWGLREFDANLIIAIVQDGARHGEAPFGEETCARLSLIRANARSWRPEACLLASIALGAAMLVALLILFVGV